MKALILLASYWLSLVVATPVIHEVPKTSNKISYKDDKVIRLRVGDNVAKVNSLIKNLSLSSWNGDPQANKYVDLLVPRSKLVAFANLTASMETHVMHEDLGASIKKEAEYKPYAGRYIQKKKFPISFNSRGRWKTQLTLRLFLFFFKIKRLCYLRLV